MIESLSPLSKISRPSITGISRRERLFEFLDWGRGLPVTWVSGPAGSGKTTLIASYLDSRGLPCIWYQVDEGDSDIATFFYYMGLAAKKAAPRIKRPLPLLTPEYLLGVSTFARRFFEALFSRLKPPYVLVLDNYQDVSSDSEFHEVMREGLSVVPAGVRVIMISRIEPPAALVRLRGNGKFYFAGWRDIRFKLDEFREMSKARGLNLKEAALKQFHKRTEGWVAGLVLLTEKLDGTDFDLRFPEGPGLTGIFDYFASELFEKADQEIQDFLLKTAFLPRMTSDMAGKLTGNRLSDQILAKLNRLHYFTERNTLSEPVYQYHALFREFLLSRAAAVFSEGEIAQIQRESAALLIEAGQVEDAANLLECAKDWEALVKLILTRAEVLTAQGRSKTVEEWLSHLPGNIFENTPWLLYWMGICRMPFSLQEGREYFERAYTLFKAQKDPEGLYLSWSGIVETFLHEWNFATLDSWVSEIGILLRDYPSFPSPEIEGRVTYGMFGALMYRQPTHPDFPLWEERARRIAFTSNDLQLKTAVCSELILYYTWWTGDLSKAKMLLTAARPVAYLREAAPLTFIVRRSIEAAYLWMSALNKECIEAVNDGLAAAEASGVHVWDPILMALGIFGTLTSGNLQGSRTFLDRMSKVVISSPPIMKGFYHFLAAFAALADGDLGVARQHADQTFPLVDMGVPLASVTCNLTLGTVLVQQGEREKGLAHLREAVRISSETNIKTFEYQAFISEAQYFLEQDEEAACLEALEKAMAIGREKGFVNHTGWRSSVMSRLCAKALEAGIETEHVRNLIRKRGLFPDQAFCDIQQWPWPLKIYTLGRFEVLVNDLPLTFPGKVQKKPMELLKVLASLGPESIREEVVMDLLWPDKEGDAAHDSVKMTISRLRKLVGSEKAIQVQDGLIMFNPGHIWVDAWVFANMMKKIDLLRARQETGKGLEIIKLAEKAVELYKGHFLPMEAVPWTTSTRERLRGKFIHLVDVLGLEMERTGQWQKAAELSLRAIEVDNVSEEFYRKLMICYVRLGRNTDAIMTYRRCKSMLSESFGIPPSPQTEGVLKAITDSPSDFLTG